MTFFSGFNRDSFNENPQVEIAETHAIHVKSFGKAQQGLVEQDSFNGVIVDPCIPCDVLDGNVQQGVVEQVCRSGETWDFCPSCDVSVGW